VTRIVERDPRDVVSLSFVLACWTLHYHIAPWMQHWLRPLGALVFETVLIREALGLAESRHYKKG